jgi:MFS family permease
LQGVGGAGIFSMVPIVVAEMVQPAKYGAYNGIVSLAIAFSFLLGPLFGGAISDGATWRWIFYINLPVGFVGLMLVLVAMPAGFPNSSAITSPTFCNLIRRNVTLRGRIDYPGFSMLLAASVLLIVAIEEAGISFTWSSTLVIAFLVAAGVLLILFLVWQWYLYHAKSAREPILPWVFFKKRVMMGIFL